MACECCVEIDLEKSKPEKSCLISFEHPSVKSTPRGEKLQQNLFMSMNIFALFLLKTFTSFIRNSCVSDNGVLACG